MKIKSLVIPVVLLFFISCKKTTEPTPTPQSNLYLSTSAGSTWTYHQTDSSLATPANLNYTVTSTSKDTAINGKSYHIFTKSFGGNQYLNVTSHDYYQFDSLPAGFGAGVFERLYLKDDAAAGASWTQNQTVNISGVPFPIPVTLTFNIAEKGITMIVNNVTYNNVIHVAATITSQKCSRSVQTCSRSGVPVPPQLLHCAVAVQACPTSLFVLCVTPHIAPTGT